MVSQVLSQAILNLQGPDLVGSFREGREFARQSQVRDLSGKAARGEEGALDELKGIAPEIAFGIARDIGATDARGVANFVRDAGVGRRMLEAGDVQGFINFAGNRIEAIRATGGNVQQTESIRDRVLSGDVGGAIQELQSFDAALQQARQVNKKSFAPITIVNPATKEERLVTPTFDPATGRSGLSEADLPEGFKLKSKRVTAEEAGDIQLAKSRSGQSVKISGEMFDKIAKVRKSILNIDDAIAAIDSGAATGKVESFMPSIRAASVELDNIAGRMGLDIVGATTFGALSESELKFALDVALPRNLNETELRQWLVDKKVVQDKLRSELNKSAIFLNKGGTIGELLQQRGQPQAGAEASEEDIQFTMKKRGLTREQVLQALGGQ